MSAARYDRCAGCGDAFAEPQENYLCGECARHSVDAQRFEADGYADEYVEGFDE